MTEPLSENDARGLLLGEFCVEDGWVDYNGHMNVGWYGISFDRALDIFVETQLGMGETFARIEQIGLVVLQSHLQFHSELMLGQRFTISIRTLDADEKRLHVFMTMIGPDSRMAATAEQLLLAMDLGNRRSTALPKTAQLALAHLRQKEAGLPSPAGAGRSIGLRRKA